MKNNKQKPSPPLLFSPLVRGRIPNEVREKGVRASWVRVILALFVFCYLGSSALAANNRTGTYPGNFLKLGVGVKPLSMGNAFTAVADDLSAIYWNPAGLTQTRSFAFSSMYSPWLADMSYSNISFAAYLPNSSMSTGLSIDYVSAGRIEKTTASRPYGTGSYFTPTFITVTAPFAFRPLDFLSFGFNARTILDAIDTSEALGYSVDAGLLWKFTDNFSAGFCARNLIGSVNNLFVVNNLAKNELSLNYSLGLCCRLPFLCLGLDYNLPSDNQGCLSLGAEYSLKDILFGRIGFSTRSEENAGGNLGAGLGLKLGILKIDYAYAPYGDLGITHRLSLGMVFPEWKHRASSEAQTAEPSVLIPPPSSAPAAEVKQANPEASIVIQSVPDSSAPVKLTAPPVKSVLIKAAPKKPVPVKKKTPGRATRKKK